MRRPTLVLLLAAAVLAAAAPAEAARPKAPAPSTPAADATVAALPAFTWSPVKGAERYEVQVAADARFGSIVGGRSIKTGNSAATVVKSVPDGEYFWRVRAIDEAGQAGPWSAERTLTKAWTQAPALQAPTGGLQVDYPAQPLVLRWTDVDHAVKYLVTVASDPSLAQPVVGTKPVETSATVYTPPNALSVGTYYWAVQPVDAQGHKGARSAVGKFVWGWPSTVSLAEPAEMRGDARVAPPTLSDPELSWAPVPGASGYEVQINFFDSFSAGSMVESETTIGTRYSPRTVLPNNTYHWRVRPLDVNGNPSGWSDAGTFAKSFDTLEPTIPNLRLRDNEADPFRDRGTGIAELPVVQHPLLEWDPVPGASGYEIQTAEYRTSPSKYCDWSQQSWARTPHTAWSPIAGATANAPGPSTWAEPFEDRPDFGEPAFVAGRAYCVRVLAVANFRYSARQDDVLSEWTSIHNGPGAPASKVSTDTNAPAFVYEAPQQIPVADPDRDPRMDVDDYLSPADGAALTETPVLRWKAVPGAAGYWVVIARDAEFTNVPEIAFVRQPQHAPRTTFRDESTAYWWVVIPALNANGSGVTTGVAHNNKRSFHKASTAPEHLEPAPGAVVAGQPRFRWKGADGALEYKLQVSTDATFKDSSRELDTVRTASTAYTPTKTYPVDTVLHWRVTAVAVDRIDTKIELRPSTAGTFRRTLARPVPAADNAPGGSAIPALRWSPVEGAVAYDIHVDQSDGKQKDLTVKSTAFTPVTWYGTGVWRWQVRAVFPGDAHSAYSDPVAFTRFIPAPPSARAERSKRRVLIGWEGLRNVERYLVQVSADSSFGRVIEQARVDGTAFAPDLAKTAYRAGGTLYWRVAAVDEGGNVGAFSSGTLTLERRLVLTPTGKPRRGRSATLSIRVTDAGRKPVAGAVVRLKGAGVRVTRRSDRSGRVRMDLRPRRRGTIVLTATKKGYGSARTTLRVR